MIAVTKPQHTINIRVTTTHKVLTRNMTTYFNFC